MSRRRESFSQPDLEIPKFDRRRVRNGSNNRIVIRPIITGELPPTLPPESLADMVDMADGEILALSNSSFRRYRR